MTRTIRFKLFTALTVALVFLATFALLATAMQLRSATRAAVLEAEHVAYAIAHIELQNAVDDPTFLQEHVASFEKLYQRDIFIVDSHMRIVADTDAAEIGSIFSEDPTGAVQETLLDGVARTFIEENATEAGDAMQAVVPIRMDPSNPASQIIGAVIFEYTPFYNTLMVEAWSATYVIGGGATLLFVLAVVLGRRFTRGISKPLGELQRAATEIAAGDSYHTRVPVESGDEIGALAAAFNKMAEDIGASRTNLLKHGQALEAQAGELVRTNALLEGQMAKERLAAERIEYLAYHDGLTELPNRSMFSKLLTQGISRDRRYNRHLAILFIDLDRFKQINDTLGHDAGDLLLQEMARRLKQSLRESDTVGRFGGDEFVILLPEVIEERQVVSVAHKVLAAIGRPFSLRGQELRVTASIGISTFPKDGEDEQALMKNADIAMYQAKESGRNNFQFYSAALNVNSFERLALESSLRRALERNELTLHYQPKKNFRTGKITGMEALLRWQHPDLGMVAPTQFIPVAEETGLIVPIGRWVLKTACLQNVAWQQEGRASLVVAVNLSARQFADENLLDDIAAVLQETGMSPILLELEITESMIMHNTQKTKEILTRLRELGISIAIDDFGTGYSSLSNIKQFPIDTLKIDRSFIRDLATNADDRGITEAIIAMGRTLNLHLVAEGVETKEQADFLIEQSCDEFQGYYFSKPLPADQFSALIETSWKASMSV